MVQEQDIKKEEESKDEKDEEKEVEKTESPYALIAELTQTVKSGFDKLNTLSKDVAELKEKAMEPPKELDAKPAGTAAEEDVGDKTDAPAQPYPSETSEQASITDASPESPAKEDGEGLKMQQKSHFSENQFTTSTPRPNATFTNKGNEGETSPAMQLLNDIRKADAGEFTDPATRLSEIGLKLNKGLYGEGF